jgi:hypothetical protein
MRRSLTSSSQPSLQNPAIKGFADKMQAGGAPPSMEEMMQSEELKGLAAQFGAK